MSSEESWKMRRHPQQMCGDTKLGVMDGILNDTIFV